MSSPIPIQRAAPPLQRLPVEQRLELALQIGRGGVWEWRASGEVDYDDAYFQLLGVDPDVGRAADPFWARRVHPADIDAVRQAFESHVAGHSAQFECEYRLRHEDGRWLWVLDRGRAIARDGAGQATVVVGFLMEITAKRQAEGALRESEERFRLATDAANGFVYEVDLATGTAVRYGQEKFTGYSPGQMALNMDGWLTCVHPEDRERVRVTIDSSRYANRDYSLEYRVVKRDGTQLDVWHRGAYHRDETGRQIRAYGFVEDVTSRVKIERELRKREQDLQLQGRIIETLNEGVAVTDEESNILFANPAFERMLGFDPGGVIGRRCSSLSPLPATQYQRVRERLYAGLATNECAHAEVEVLRKDGSCFTAASTLARIAVGSESRLVVVISDVTERKRLERQILQIANREQQRIGSDLHDGLGQELTGVALLLRGLASRAGRSSDEDLRADVEQLIGIVNGAIDSTRALARGLSPVTADRDGLVMALEALVSQYRQRHGIRVMLHNDLPDGQAIDDAAATHLYRIAQEALTNAIRHGRAKRVSIGLDAEAGRIELVVQDNGAGFDSSATRDMGMGLKIMRYRAQMLGGELTVESTPGIGTVVRCQCPDVVEQVDAIAS